MNNTFITLIPKRIGACNFNRFRPISLCNFCYKIISKILVNRLRPLFSKVIEPSHVAFVPGRWITENVVLAQEIMHSFSQSRKKRGNAGFKLDFIRPMIVWNENSFAGFLKLLGLTPSSLI
jgi:hypothetical protein